MNLIYTFTKKLNESNLDLYVQLWCDSYLNNKKYHNIKLYTDDESVDLFKNVFEDIEILNTNNVKFLDDLKIKINPNSRLILMIIILLFSYH